MTDINAKQVTTPNLIREKLETLKKTFPELFTDEGALDPDELKSLVEVDGVKGRERYQFTWYGKSRAKRHAFTPSRAALTYDPDRSVNPEKANGNLIIEGENLEVLKLLTSAYRGKVKCIYIDPPYNKDADVIYKDDYSQNPKEYWEEAGSYRDGIKLDTNTETSGRYHSDWLSMIYGRLLVARQLLSDDGVLFASIDDNENHNLRRLMDEVFGEENFISQIVWQRSKKGDAKTVANIHEYILVYTKNREKNAEGGVWRRPKAGVTEVLAQYEIFKSELNTNHALIRQNMMEWYRSLPRNDPRKAHKHYNWSDDRGLYFAADFAGPDDGRKSRPRHDILHPVTGKSCKKPSTGWRWDEVKTNWALSQTPPRIHFGEDETTIPNRKSYLHEISDEPFASVFYTDGRSATLEVEGLIGKGVFSFPKNKEVIAELVSLVCEPEAIVLDFFAGSGTTAHAIMALNKKDGGNRRFMLVQLPEATDKQSAAYANGFKTISDITIQRCRRVIEGYGKDPKPIDTGFKVYRLTKSNFPRAEFVPDPDKSEEENVKALEQYIAEKESSFQMTLDGDTILDEVLLKHGFPLNYTASKQEQFSNNVVYLAEHEGRKAYVCLDPSLDDNTIDYFKKHADTTLICLERALDTTKKWNLNHSLGERLKAL